ncbi:hypothetical protein RU08_00210 [Pseudomonas fulva]|uniref:Uncharacterized protein n=1 Tax=Pseudomonas fulva TaxID=47880 RepID=A0A0D0JK00_9PSED|nr:hypothetical protein RU08_00210 [Pseudomonas fulva]
MSCPSAYARFADTGCWPIILALQHYRFAGYGPCADALKPRPAAERSISNANARLLAGRSRGVVVAGESVRSRSACYPDPEAALRAALAATHPAGRRCSNPGPAPMAHRLPPWAAEHATNPLR